MRSFSFENNYMKLITDKCYLLVSGTKYERSWTRIGDGKILERNKIKLSDLTIDTKLKFKSHIANISFKANQKLSALSRVTSFFNF